jgi:hypothetical protein
MKAFPRGHSSLLSLLIFLLIVSIIIPVQSMAAALTVSARPCDPVTGQGCPTLSAASIPRPPQEPIVRLTDFNPIEHGFKFSNSEFTNSIARIAGQFGVPGLLQHVPHETKGRCGGMAYAALDYFFNNIPIPRRTTTPPDGDVLADYILTRLFHSFSVPTAQKFVQWSFVHPHDIWLGDGARNLSNRIETPRIMRELDRGTPVVVGLVNAHIPNWDLSQLREIGDRNHQVVAYGYRHYPSNGIVQFFIYDNNFPNMQVILSMNTRTSEITYTVPRPGNVETTSLRGFFLHDYRGPLNPPAVNQPPVADPGGPYTGILGSPVFFDGSRSNDPDSNDGGGQISSFEWDFGDGTAELGARPVHTYNRAGTFTVTLEVTDNDGAVGSSSTTAAIGEQEPADFTITCPQGTLSIFAGESRQTMCTVTSLNGFTAPVSLNCESPTNPHIACSFSPSQVAPPSNGSIDSVLTVNVAFESILGTSDLRILGTGEGITFSTAIPVAIDAG